MPRLHSSGLMKKSVPLAFELPAHRMNIVHKETDVTETLWIPIAIVHLEVCIPLGAMIVRQLQCGLPQAEGQPGSLGATCNLLFSTFQGHEEIICEIPWNCELCSEGHAHHFGVELNRLWSIFHAQ